MSFKSLCYSGTGAEFRGTVSLVNNSFDRIVVRFYLHSWLMEVLFKKLSSLSMRQWPIIAFQMFESLSESPHHNLTHVHKALYFKKAPVAPLECVSKLKNPTVILLEPWSLYGLLQWSSVQGHYSALQAEGSVGLEVNVNLKSCWGVFVFSLSEEVASGCWRLEDDTWRLCSSSKWQMGKAPRGEAIERVARPPLLLPPSFIIITTTHSTVHYSPVRFRSASRLPTPEAGFPWQLCAAAVTMAATAVSGGGGGGGRMRAPVPAGSACHWKATRGRPCRLGLYSVPWGCRLWA